MTIKIIKAESTLPKATETNELLRSVANDLRSEAESEQEDELFNRAIGNSPEDSKETKL